MVSDVVPQEEETIESGEVIKQAEGVPRASPEGIRPGKLFQIRQEGAGEPKPQDKFLLPFRSSFDPSREDRHVKIQSNQHVNIPHVRSGIVEGKRDAGDILQAGTNGLAISIRQDKTFIDNALIRPY